MRTLRCLLGPCLATAAAIAAACSPPPGPPADAATDASDAANDLVNPPQDAPGVDADVPDPHGGLRLPRCEETEPPDGGDPFAPVASTLVGTVEPMVVRVAMADPELNPVTEAAETAYRMRGFDRYRRGAAQARVVRTELGGVAPPAGAVRKSLAYFVQLSDTQLVDDESPARYALLDTIQVSSAARPQEAYIPRATSAMNRTLAALERPERPFEFGVFAGDCADSAQLNELRWFIQLMDGARGLNTDSGADDDPVPGADNDPKDPFDPAGFPAPWYFVPGNHDVEVQGNFVPDNTLRATALGMQATNGTRDYTRWYAPIRRASVPADPNRRLISRDDIVRELASSPATPGPVGHGYAPGADVSIGAHYTVDLPGGLLRLIALDTSDETGGSNGLVRRQVIDRFLRPALERAQTDGVLVLLTSHHPTASIDQFEGVLSSRVVPDAVPAREIEQLVASYPNVIAWLVGHQHDVRVRPIRGADAAHPGYWEIQSGSIADWPAQSRVVEIVDNGNGTLSLFGTMVDFEPASCLERRFRRLAMMDYVSGWVSDHTGTPADRNVELVIPIPATAAARVAARSAMPTTPTRIESETTLRGMR